VKLHDGTVPSLSPLLTASHLFAVRILLGAAAVAGATVGFVYRNPAFDMISSVAFEDADVLLGPRVGWIVYCHVVVGVVDVDRVVVAWAVYRSSQH